MENKYENVWFSAQFVLAVVLSVRKSKAIFSVLDLSTLIAIFFVCVYKMILPKML